MTQLECSLIFHLPFFSDILRRKNKFLRRDAAMQPLELARMDELNRCYEIIEAGKRFQREQGFVQWTDDYPNVDTIRDDIERKNGYVVKFGDKIAAYMCIDFEGEPAYDRSSRQARRPYGFSYGRLETSPFFYTVPLQKLRRPPHGHRYETRRLPSNPGQNARKARSIAGYCPFASFLLFMPFIYLLARRLF